MRSNGNLSSATVLVRQVSLPRLWSMVAVATVAVALGLGLFPSRSAAATQSSTVSITSGSPVVIVSDLHKGDVVDVQATLTTSDPGEIGEAEDQPEALVLQSTGGFSWSFQAYGQPRAMRFVATADGESFSGFIQEFDNDESASVTVTVNSTAQLLLSQQTKDLLDKVAASETVLATGSATAGTKCLAAVCNAFDTTFSSTAWLSSVVAAQLALDAADFTPDPNYKVVQQPVFQPPAEIPAQDGLTQTQADLTNLTLASLQRLTDLGQAIKVTQDRVQSAVDAGDDAAALQQQFALQAQMNAYSKTVELVSNLQKEMADALEMVVRNIGGLRITSAAAAQATTQDFLFRQTITSDDVFSFEIGVATNGLPDEIVATLTQIGASGEEINTIQQLAMVQDTQTAAGEYPARIGDSALADDLRALAASVQADLPLDIAHLIGQVKERDLPRGNENSLLTKLTSAQRSLNAGDSAGACRGLATFINEVKAQSGKKITGSDAQALIDEATVLRESADCGAA
jgi:hypothetical protein